MSDNPDEMPVSQDENVIAPEHGLSVEEVLTVDDQLKALLDASDKKPASPEAEAENYEATLAEQANLRKKRPLFIKGVGVVATATVIVAGMTIIVRKHRS